MQSSTRPRPKLHRDQCLTSYDLDSEPTLETNEIRGYHLQNEKRFNSDWKKEEGTADRRPRKIAVANPTSSGLSKTACQECQRPRVN